MSRLLSRRKSSIKPISIVNQPSAGNVIEFRWSISAAQLALLESSQRRISSPPLTDRNSKCQLSCSTEKTSPRSVDKKGTLLESTDQGNNERMSPLLLTYSQLRNAQRPLQTNRTAKKRVLLYPSSNHIRKGISDVKSNVSSSSGSTSSSSDQYKRLPISQLRRLHVSEKYIKEAKKLYFNINAKSFVPRLSIIELA